MMNAKFLILCGFTVIAGWVILVIVGLLIKMIGNGDLDWLLFRTEIEEGKIIIAQVESFRYVHNRIPSDKEFVSILKRPSVSLYRGEESCPCYSLQVNNYDYAIEFSGMTVGEMFVYDSKTDKWQRRGS
jgi:hypothetical protein